MANTYPAQYQARLLECLDAFGASAPIHLCQTDLAGIWKVTLQSGDAAVLKLYKGGNMRNETHGARLLKEAGGTAAVTVIDVLHDAILMEHLEGVSLGDLSRTGEDERANTMLVQAVAQLHKALPQTLSDLPKLDAWFESLWALRFGPDCPAALRGDMIRASQLARTLLAQSGSPRPLHGDVHHDNSILTLKGAKLIDAKGLFGDPAFEMANSFRNPKGANRTVRDPQRAISLALLIRDKLGIEPKLQLSWAAVKCALSIAWRAGSTLNATDPDHDVLAMLLDLSAA